MAHISAIYHSFLSSIEIVKGMDPKNEKQPLQGAYYVMLCHISHPEIWKCSSSPVKIQFLRIFISLKIIDSVILII